MSRGRKAKANNSDLGWQQVFSKNVGKYLQYAIIELSKVESHATETGEDLLKRIKEEKRTSKKDKALPAIKASEIPYEIPKNWAWCRLGEMSINCDGARIPVSQAEREKREKIYDYYGASGKIDKIDGYTHDGKYLLIGEDGANLVAKSTPIAFIAQGRFWVNNHAHVLDFIDDITMDFMVYCLNSIDINPFLTGGFQPKLSQGNLNLIPIPLPPLNIQTQIVDFLTDFENENLKEDGYYFNQEVEQKVIALHEAQLKGVELANELTHQLALVKSLRQQLLQDAVQGKLVAQHPDDEPASTLLEKIKAEKEKLIAEKKLKKEKPLPPIKPEEIPFEIPEGWVWCRLGEIALHSEAGKSYQALDLIAQANQIGVIKTSAITSSFFLEDENKLLPNQNINIDKIKIEKGDLIFCRASGSKGLAGKACLVERTPKAQLVLSDKSIRYVLSNNINKKFLQNINSSAYGEEYYMSLGTKKSTTMNNITREQFNSFPIPLPPLPEQTRIVQKLEELMQYCDGLEAGIKESMAQNECLLQQVLREALRG